MTRRADDVLRRVRSDIVAGVHPPGSRLTEASLTAAYGVSRVPVREALKQLEAEGFVTSTPYAGVRVAQLGAGEAEDLFTVRRTIEEITARRCAQRFRRTPEDPEVVAFGEQLDQLVATGCGAVESADRADLVPLNTEFHLSLAAFSGSTAMLTLLRQVSSKIEWLYAMDVDVRGPHSWSEHRGIADAVHAGRAAEAGRLMRQHVTNSLQGYLTRHVPDGSGP
jgi:DNA-binding GntR family transcriptional regulator